ncbi:hypothetical protein ELI54_06115 [Rhizobium ruizarguesonis]|nr:hypothetical protein [Rhizobium leguminosarum]NEI96910.1 hypothetical protein [Rhizobium ruizarguesonis]NEJ37665.1 hypothetical protein [Rhizobium ruizarguesonis]TAT77960.1 hypothetical protein ELI56_06930 [Rhizobium ruizarguesonis]TAT87828.1 hypothetical protein ELI54_06115 [Rhizobium ruizarguesonis]
MPGVCQQSEPGKSPGFLFGSVVERGIHEGDMKSETNPRALARFLRAIIQGMSVQARDGASLEELLDIAVLAIAEVARHRA